eukprot:6914707-Lingulodinium_polyedra.AAC.1
MVRQHRASSRLNYKYNAPRKNCLINSLGSRARRRHLRINSAWGPSYTGNCRYDASYYVPAL